MGWVGHQQLLCHNLLCFNSSHIFIVRCLLFTNFFTNCIRYIRCDALRHSHTGVSKHWPQILCPSQRAGLRVESASQYSLGHRFERLAIARLFRASALLSMVQGWERKYHLRLRHHSNIRRKSKSEARIVSPFDAIYLFG